MHRTGIWGVPAVCKLVPEKLPPMMLKNNWNYSFQTGEGIPQGSIPNAT
jgi:hypothetical protein